MAVIGTIIDPSVSLPTHITNQVYAVTSTPGSVTTNGTYGSVYSMVSGTTISTTTGSSTIVEKFNDHLLSRWDYSAHVLNLSGKVGIGIYDKQTELTIYPRNVWYAVDSSAKTLSLTIFEVNGPVWTKVIPDGFNYADFTIKVRYQSMYASVVLKDSNNVYVIARYRYNLKTHQTHPRGRFGLKQLSGTSDVHTIGVYSDFPIGIKVLCIGDSIAAGRTNYPESYRFGSQMRVSFINSGNLGYFTDTWASGSMLLDSVELIAESIVYAAPQNLVILIGDNDDGVNIGNASTPGSWVARYLALLDKLIDAGINVKVVSMTPEAWTSNLIDDALRNHQPQHEYIQDGQMNADLSSLYSHTVQTINIWDSIKLMPGDPQLPPPELGITRDMLDRNYSNDYVHLNKVGHGLLATAAVATI